MKIRKAYKYRIYPTKAQQTNLENQFSMCRYLYNWSLKERTDAYEQEKRSVHARLTSLFDNRNELLSDGPNSEGGISWFAEVSAGTSKAATDGQLKTGHQGGTRF